MEASSRIFVRRTREIRRQASLHNVRYAPMDQPESFSLAVFCSPGHGGRIIDGGAGHTRNTGERTPYFYISHIGKRGFYQESNRPDPIYL